MDRKTDWNLGETIAWIRTRDHNRVARMWDMSEFQAVAVAFFEWGQLQHRVIGAVSDEARLRIAADRSDTVGAGQLSGASALAAQAVDLEEDVERTARSPVPTRRLGYEGQSKTDDVPGLDRIPHDVMRKVQIRKVRMTVIRSAGSGVERLPVSAAEANELELRITDDALAPVIAWSQIQQATAGTSPRFSRVDVIRAWPELSKKTAAVTGAILRHLRVISTPERPLTKAEALDRCLAEVRNAYPEAFKKAWAQLESSRKRGRGKHGPRAR